MSKPVSARSALFVAGLALPAVAVAHASPAPEPSQAQAVPIEVNGAPARRIDSADRFQQALGLIDPGLAAAPASVSATHRRRSRTRLERSLHSMVAAGSRISRRPYLWGGGHGSFHSAGYDCSGSVSYVLHAAGLLSAPADSSGLESFGQPGPGRHVTIYANAGHALMTIEGRRFDTIAFQETGTRWSSHVGSVAGYVIRHPRGM